MGNLDALKFNKDSDRRARIWFRNLLRDPKMTSKPMIPLDAEEEDIPPLQGPTIENVRKVAKVARLVGWLSRVTGISLSD